MKLSVLLLLALPALSSATLESGNNAEQRNVSFTDSADQPLLSVFTLRQKMHVEAQSSSIKFDDVSNLEWVTWNNNLPNDAVSIVNGYYNNRIDYVCKYGCNAGYYTPSDGPYCHYRGTVTTDFELLVNNDNLDYLDWVDDSYGNVPQNSVRTCPGQDIYVGRNKYGLGKTETQYEAFFLPWPGGDIWYKYYQALTTNNDITSQKIHNVIYKTDDPKIINYPPSIIHESTTSNSECHTVTKTDSISKTSKVERRRESNFANRAGINMSITAGIPDMFSQKLEISAETTYQFSSGTTVTEEITDTATVKVKVPPNHSCVVKMIRYDNKLEIPFTASVTRTYRNGATRKTSISGTYHGVQIGDIRANMERCQPLQDAEPCP